MNPLLLNRDFQLPPDGWIHVAPLGEFPHPDGVLQVIDRQSVDSMVNEFRNQQRTANFPGVLVDFDHFSDDTTKPSEAAGWITDLQARDAGLFAQVRWSDLGESAVKGGRYRLVSPVFARSHSEKLLNTGKQPQKLRPLRLIKLALTNDPNLRGMEPLSNRQSETPAADNTNPPQRTTMKQVAVKLGLAPEASEEAVLAAVETIMNTSRTLTTERDTLKNRNTALETENQELLKSVFDQKFANRFADDKRDAAKAEFVKNRAGFEATMDALKPAEAKKECLILNRATAGNPGNRQINEQVTNRVTAIKSLVESIKNRDHCTYESAHARAQQEKPELFN